MTVQWLRLGASNAGAQVSIPGQGTRSHMLQLRPGMALKSKWKKCEKSSKKNNEGRLAALGGEHYKATVSNDAKQTDQ